MPAITAQQRSDLVLLVNGVFGAAPTSRVLSNLVKLVEEGNSVDQVATMLTNNTNFESIYAPALLNSEFATQFTANLLGAAATTETTARVEALVTSYLSAGDTRTEAVWKVTKLLSETEDAAFATAKAQLNNKADVSLTFALDTSYTELMTLEQLQSVIANVTSDEATVTAAKTAIANGTAVTGVNTGETFSLSTSIDTITGTSKNDVINALINNESGSTDSTFTALDTIDGGAGTDTLNINVTTSTANISQINPNLVTLSNVETINIRAVDDIDNDATAANAALDLSGVSGLQTINTTKSVDARLVASSSQNVNVSNATGATVVDGGNNVSVTDSAAVTLGATTAVTGTVSVTDSSATDAIAIDGGTDVTVTTTTSKASSGAVTVGQGGATADLPTGAVSVTQNVTSDGTAATAGNVTVTGGSTVSITSNLTNTAAKGGSANAITAGAYQVTAGDATTAVTVTQNATATDYASETTSAGTKETAVVTFGALKAGEEVYISEGAAGTADLSFVATKDLTAAEVAQAIANLTSADTQASGGVTANGYFQGSLDSGWTSSAASGASVTFTATTVGNKTDLVVETDATGSDTDSDNDATNNADFGIVVTDGTSAVTTTAVDLTADYGTVVIDDNATASITTVTLNGYDTATIGNTTALSALTTANLSNSSGANVIDNGTATSLTLNLDNIKGSTDLDNGAASLTSLTVNTSGKASSTALTANTVKTLNVNASANLTVTPTALAALETLNVTGSGDVTVGDISTATTSVAAGAATGAISATVDGTKAVVTTGSGNDSISVDTTAVSKAVSLGAGNDTFTFANAGTSAVPTAAIDGGEGTDTIAMNTATAESLDANTNFATAITSFEQLTITDATSATIEADNLGFSYVTYAAAATGTLNDFAANGTVVFEAASNNATVVLDDATGSSDVTNVVLDNKSVNPTPTKAVYSLDLTGLVTDDAADTVNIGGVVALTGIYSATTAAAALDGQTITISGVTYDIVDAGSDTVTLTAQTFANVTASIAVTSVDNGATAGNANATAGATAPSTNGIAENVAADVDFGTATIADVETINLTTNDTTTSVVSAVDENTFALVADSVTTLNIDGSSDLDLTTTAADLETVNASSMTGKLTYTVSVADVVLNAGSGADVITASANGVTVNGGAGNDRIIVSDNVDLLKIDGGEGSDTFVIDTSASSNKSNYAVFSNVGSGDVFDFEDGNTFQATEITLAQGATESTQAYLDQAMTVLGDDGIGWFQYNGNTFIVVDQGGDSANSFVDGTDQVVMITGLVDLSTASFNQTDGTLEIA